MTYKFNPKKKIQYCRTLGTETMFSIRKPIPKGCSVFLYYEVDDRFITQGEVKDIMDKEKVWWVPAINKSNALRKIKKNFKTKL